jgi:muramoyltetrapeptide carboxypeptidase
MRSIHPPALPPGAKVAVTCPASPAPADSLKRGMTRLRDLGMTVITGRSCAVRNALWAGEDRARAAELVDFLLDPSVKAIFAGRGGVGCMRLLPYLDELPNDPPPTWIIGRSDLTALHFTFWQRYGWVGLSGPMVATDFGSETSPPKSVIDQTFHLLGDPEPLGRITSTTLDVWRNGVAEGFLVPANLSILASMVGTPYLPSLEGAILVLEEVNEPARRIDRMLTQLHLAGALRGVAGLILGQFTACEPGDPSFPSDLITQILREHADRLAVPVLAGFPHGHEPLFVPLPVGIRARIETDPPALILLEGAAALAQGDRT